MNNFDRLLKKKSCTFTRVLLTTPLDVVRALL